MPDRQRLSPLPPDVIFDDIVQRAASALGMGMAGLSLFEKSADANAPILAERFKATVNLPTDVLTAEHLFCQPHQLRYETRRIPFVITDTLSDKRLRDHPLVSHPPYICFYAGIGLFSTTRELIGMLSVFDTAARQLTEDQAETLANLAALVMVRLDAHRMADKSRKKKVIANQSATDTAGTNEHNGKDEPHGLRDQLGQIRETARLAEEALLLEKAIAEAVIEHIDGDFCLIDDKGRLIRWNQKFQDSTGYSATQIRQMNVFDLIVESGRDSAKAKLAKIIEQNSSETLESSLKRFDGVEVPYLIQGYPLNFSGERFCLSIGRDLTHLHKSEQEILLAKERLDLALKGSNLALWDYDLRTETIYFNEGWSSLLGGSAVESVYPAEEAVGWSHPEDVQRLRASFINALQNDGADLNCEYRVSREGGPWVWLHSRGKVTERDADGRARRLTGTSADISERKAAEARAEFLATRDPLTGLPNRLLLNDRLEQGIANAARQRERAAFMFIDLDRFKTINDSLGHDVGDELLKGVANRLSACIRANDTVARLGGDEFAVILENISADNNEAAHTVAEKMIASLAAPMLINGHQLNTSCSIGISIFPGDGTDAQTLMKHADLAMYDAKAKGRNNFQFFSHEMNERTQRRLSIENFLRLAVRRNELVLHFQPRVSFATGGITGVEALLRWQHPRLGLLYPASFLSIAEDAGMMVSIGEWVISTAFRQAAEWQKSHHADLRMAINLSPAQLFDGQRLLRFVETAASESGVALSNIDFEISETVLLKNGEETTEVLKKLRSLGVGLTIDDFGTGHSSLSNLRKLPVDAIKIDSSFIQDIGKATHDDAVIGAIVAMAHGLKLNTIAEGVEKEDQYQLLHALHRDEYQGFLCSVALPPDEFRSRFLS